MRLATGEVMPLTYWFWQAVVFWFVVAGLVSLGLIILGWDRRKVVGTALVLTAMYFVALFLLDVWDTVRIHYFKLKM